MSERTKKVLLDDFGKLAGGSDVDIFSEDGKNETAKNLAAVLDNASKRTPPVKKERIITDMDPSRIKEIDEIVFLETDKARGNDSMKIIKRAGIIRELLLKGLEAYWTENPKDKKRQS